MAYRGGRPQFTKFRNRKKYDGPGCFGPDTPGPSGSGGIYEVKTERRDESAGRFSDSGEEKRDDTYPRRSHGRASFGHDYKANTRGRGHPPHLRGKAIGLYYASLNKKKMGDKKEEMGRAPTVYLEPEREMQIRQLLDCTLAQKRTVNSSAHIKTKPKATEISEAEIEELKRSFLDDVEAIGGMEDFEAFKVKSEHRIAGGSKSNSSALIKTEPKDTELSKEELAEIEDVKKVFVNDLHAADTEEDFASLQIKAEYPDPYENRKRSHLKLNDLLAGEVAVASSSVDDDNFEIVTRKSLKRPRSSCSSQPQSDHDSGPKKYDHVSDSQFKRNFLRSITETIESKLDRLISSHLSLPRNELLDSDLKKMLLSKNNSTHYKKMYEFRQTLPSFKMRDEILQLIQNNQVVVISGETGCGKTTQVAQFILDSYIMRGEGSLCRVVCTQPRRISATSVAERVAYERDEELGEISVGYQIRLEKKVAPNQGSILYCTTGVLLQWMRTDPSLQDMSHVILDEIHERDVTSDFVITLLKSVIPKRPDLKVVLMSATLNAEHFSRYFNNCPCINIPGFTYPVEELYLEDVLELTKFEFPAKDLKGWRKHAYKNKLTREETDFANFVQPYIRNLEHSKKYSVKTLTQLRNPISEEINIELIATLVQYICTSKPDGAILIFVPGWEQISKLNKQLTTNKFFSPSRHLIIPLHSMMPTTVQRTVFDRPPAGVRKIVIATNIAETSITIDDVVYVVDSGKIKMKNYDVANNVQTLQPEWVSLANARQRRGRAGRVQPGICYHLYSRAREMALENYPLPEMLRTRLDEVILQVKILQLGKVRPFLSRLMNPPEPRAVDLSLELLERLNALDKQENLTPLGYHLAKLPVDPQTGKMLLMGAIFSCVNPILSVAASLGFKDAFQIPLGQEMNVDRKKVELSGGSKSDHLLLAKALMLWEEEEKRGHGRSFCWEYYLSPHTLGLLRDMKKQFADYLCNMNFLQSHDPRDWKCNINSNNSSLVKAIICAGLYPNVAYILKVRRNKRGISRTMRTPEDGRVDIHPKSVNDKTERFESPLLVYHLKLKSSKIYLHDTTMVHPLPLLFFGDSLNFLRENNTEMVTVGKNLKFRCKRSTSHLVMDLREQFELLLEHQVSHPSPVDWTDTLSYNTSILKAIVDLITYEDKGMALEASDCREDENDDDDDDVQFL